MRSEQINLVAETVTFTCAVPEGVSDFEEVTVSLKRYPDTKREPFSTISSLEVILPSQKEIDRRYENIRSRMQTAGLDALFVCGNQYAGFEGAVFYTSGFEIVHRYVYVVIPLDGEPTLVFPREAR
jgi:hypothetical protein